MAARYGRIVDRLRIGVAAQVLDHWHVRDAKPQQEATVGLLVQSLVRVRRRHGVAGIDVGDAGCDDKIACAREQPGGKRNGIAPPAFGYPQGAG